MYQHDSQIDRDDGLKEERFEVVGHVRDHDQKDGWDIHGEDGAQQSPGKCKFLSELSLLLFGQVGFICF